MNRLLDQLREKYPGAETFKFGDSEWLCEHLITLVQQGKKTATCGALRDFDNGNEALPVVGRQDIALHWDGRPAVVIETLEVSECKFQEVSEAFALAEGENDDLNGWRHDHQKYFERNGGFDPAMMLVCERFHVVELLTLRT